MLSWLLLFAAGCDPVPPTGLDEVEFAAGVRLDTNGPIQLTAAPGGADATIHVRVPDGREVYSGPRSIPALRPLEVRVPLGTDGLWVQQDGVADPTWVEIRDGVAHLDAEGPR